MSNKVSDQLFRLIKSLSSPEKRAFKIYSTRNGGAGDTNYVKIFDAIDAQEEYDEEAILKKYKNKNFSIVKNRLYDNILKSLDLHHANSSIDAQLMRELHCAEILFKKTLYDQCSRVLSSAKKVATKYERHSVLLEIYSWQKKLIEQDNYAGMTESDIDAFLKEDDIIGQKVKNFNDYWNIKSRVFMVLNKRGKARTQEELTGLKNIIDNRLLKAEDKALSIETKYLYNHIYSAYYFGVGEYKMCYKFLKKNVELIEEHVHIFEEEPNVYFSILTNIIYIGSQLKHYEEVFEYLKKLHDVPNLFEIKNEDLEIKLFSSTYSIEITLYNNLGDFSKSISLVPAIEKGLNDYAHKLNKVRVAYFYSTIVNAYFGQEDYNKALRWNNKIINDKEIDQIEEAHCFAEIMNVIIHLELKNDDVLPYAIRCAFAYLKAHKRVYKFETVFLDFVSSLMKDENSLQKTKVFKQLLNDLLELKKDPMERTPFEYFDFISWAESKVQRKSFRVIVEGKAGK